MIRRLHGRLGWSRKTRAAPTLGYVRLLVRLSKLESHPRDSRAQGLHLTGFLKPTLEGSFSLVAGYGPGYYG